MRGLLKRLRDVFRKNEYIQVDYADANVFGIAFREVDDEVLASIQQVVNSLESASILPKELNTIPYRIVEPDAFHNAVATVVNKDYQKTYFEAISNNWNFNYFVSYFDTWNKEFIAICNRLQSSQNKQIGEVMYPVLVMGKFEGQILLWDLLEDYETL